MAVSFRLRLLALALGILLSVEAVWLLAAEIIRPTLPYFTTNKAEMELAAKRQDAAAFAARVGWPRGELWVEAAITADAGLIEGATAANTAIAPITAAARLAPYDARSWLLLAIAAMQNGNDGKALAPLKMSFYMAPNDVRLIPFRLRIAVRSQSASDEELQNLIEHEMRTILTRAPMLKSSIALAYRDASAEGRRFMEGKLTVLDAQFLSELRKTPR
jgi:hypothetical protein